MNTWSSPIDKLKDGFCPFCDSPVYSLPPNGDFGYSFRCLSCNPKTTIAISGRLMATDTLKTILTDEKLKEAVSDWVRNQSGQKTFLTEEKLQNLIADNRNLNGNYTYDDWYKGDFIGGVRSRPNISAIERQKIHDMQLQIFESSVKNTKQRLIDNYESRLAKSINPRTMISNEIKILETLLNRSKLDKALHEIAAKQYPFYAIYGNQISLQLEYQKQVNGQLELDVIRSPGSNFGIGSNDSAARCMIDARAFAEFHQYLLQKGNELDQSLARSEAIQGESSLIGNEFRKDSDGKVRHSEQNIYHLEIMESQSPPFKIKIAEAHHKKYIKVYLKSTPNAHEILELINKMDSVRTANPTKPLDFTVYPHGAYSVEETFDEVRSTLEVFFAASSHKTKTQISLQGDSNLKNKMKDNIFVLHAWEGAKPSSEALALTEFLRNNGFHAEMDVMLSDKAVSLNFNEMMSRAFTDYERIIIVLSPEYKSKADGFLGGVGNEYRILLDQIQKTPEKFLFVSFRRIGEDIIPTAIAGREIIDLKKDAQDDYRLLFARLNRNPIYPFSDVTESKIEIIAEKIPTMEEIFSASVPGELPEDQTVAEIFFLHGLENPKLAPLNAVDKGFRYDLSLGKDIISPIAIVTKFVQVGIFFYAIFPNGEVQLPVDLLGNMQIPRSEEIFDFPAETVFQFGVVDIDQDGIFEVVVGAYAGFDRLAVSILKYHPPKLESAQLRKENWDLVGNFQGRYEGHFDGQSVTFPWGNTTGNYYEWTWVKGRFVDTGE